MKKLFCTLLCALLCLAALSSFAEEEPVFLLRQSDYMKSLGYEDVALDHVPERVACMTTYPFRTLYELGVNFVAVAETSTFEYPEEIKPLVMPAVMSSTFDLEGIVALEPDLVLLPDSAMATHGATLQELGIPVFAVTTKEPDQDVYTTLKNQTEAYIEAFAQDETALAAAEDIRARFAALDARIAEANERYAGKTFFGATCVSGTDFYLQAQTSTVSSMMQLLGFTNIYAESMGDTNAPASLETFADVESDLFVFTSQGTTTVEDAEAFCTECMATNQALWDTVPAVSRGDVLYLPSGYVVTAGLNIIDNLGGLIDLLDAHYAA